MPIVYFLIAIALLISWIWKPLLIIIGVALVLWLITFLISCYKRNRKRFLYGVSIFVTLSLICFSVKLCSDYQQDNRYKKHDTIRGLAIIKKHNIKAEVQKTISYKHINDSLNNCNCINYNLIYDKYAGFVNSVGYTYPLYNHSEFQGLTIKYENNYDNKYLLADFEKVVKTLSSEFGKPHLDILIEKNRTIKWQFDKLHILIYCYQDESSSIGSISIFNPEILNFEYSPIDIH